MSKKKETDQLRAREPSEEYERFEALARQVLSVPREEIDRRHEAWEREREKKNEPGGGTRSSRKARD